MNYCICHGFVICRTVKAEAAGHLAVAQGPVVVREPRLAVIKVLVAEGDLVLASARRASVTNSTSGNPEITVMALWGQP